MLCYVCFSPFPPDPSTGEYKWKTEQQQKVIQDGIYALPNYSLSYSVIKIGHI